MGSARDLYFSLLCGLAAGGTHYVADPSSTVIDSPSGAYARIGFAIPVDEVNPICGPAARSWRPCRNR